MHKLLYRSAMALSAIMASLMPLAANAGEGQPSPWQIGLQPAETPIAEQIHDFHTLLLVIIFSVAAFVLALLVWVMIRYNARANPTPSKTHHNTLLEVIWTTIPVMILIIIAIPSFRLLYAQYSFPKADLTIKAIGNQWYWSYEYPDNGNFTFDSLLKEKGELKPGEPYLLAVDNDVVVPVNKVVQVLVTSNDVIHSWTVPSFGSKIDAVPGRVTRTWFKAEKTGVFYGQCSELCGQRHAFMPIAVRVVSQTEFDAWVKKAQKEFASNDAVPAPSTVRRAADSQSAPAKLASAVTQ